MKKKNQTLKINIFNLVKKRIGNKIKIRRLVKYVVKKEGYKKLASLNIIIANAHYLKELNKRFFNKNRPTNVISFNLNSIGEIYISRDEIASSMDFYYYLIHGLLHIMGYDHRNRKTEKLMDCTCQMYLRKFSLI
ncbi:MAG: rRNA maturation RNase YbeY [bacterium]